MIDALAPPKELATLRAASARYAAAIAARGDGTPTALQTNPDAPSGPRPTFAITTLEQMHAAQKVAPVTDARATDAAPDATQTPPADPQAGGTVNRIL